MTIREILTAPDPRLKQKAPPVKAVTDAERAELDDLLETMYAAQGIGLAATQVGIMKRLLVLDVEQTSEECSHGGHPHTHAVPGKPMKFVNPEIIWSSDALNTYKEGCLSFPAHYADVKRPAEVKIRYLDERGNEQELHARGLLATCIQHEIDHLDGITFVDHLSRIRRDMILRKLKKAKKQGSLPARTGNPYAEAYAGDSAL